MKRVAYLAELGKQMANDEALNQLAEAAEQYNPWFTKQFVQYALEGICSNMLDENKLNSFAKQYSITDEQVQKTLGLIFAGNIPLVGFHDFLCGYLAGWKMQIKLSSKDDFLFKRVLELLQQIDTEANQRITLTEKLQNFDAVVATGSDSTYSYFEYYFRNYPRILRKNRNSVAILTGQETPEQLKQLADDVFLYFGLGCRNVSKLYVPVGYDITQLFPHFETYKWLHSHTKFMNNYDYQRTILLLNKTPHFANEFVMLVENENIASPIGTLYYEHWHDERVLQTKLGALADKIQCVVAAQGYLATHNSLLTTASSSSLAPLPSPFVSFGHAQQPSLIDYADGIDTMQFLLGQ
ncbi:MAG: acyl-CoA reductase [Chitinophagales bacterium]|nr:acyl-CoA reductase [Chitinophagales bacterium]